MTTLKQLQNEIEELKARNNRVEADKAWEISFSRKILVGVFMYSVTLVFFYFAGLPNPITSAIVPALAFFISTLTLPILKNIWVKYIYRK